MPPPLHSRPLTPSGMEQHKMGCTPTHTHRNRDIESKKTKKNKHVQPRSRFYRSTSQQDGLRVQLHTGKLNIVRSWKRLHLKKKKKGNYVCFFHFQMCYFALLTTAVAVPAPSEAQLRIRDSATKAMILFGGGRESGGGWGR